MIDSLAEIDLSSILAQLNLPVVLRAVAIVLLGAIATRVVARGIGTMVERRMSAQEGMIARRLVLWILGSLIFMTVMRELGFRLDVLLGAAGVLTVALGFASQTSASNLISGLFLMAERPFVVGDLIQIDTSIGEVLSIDLLSVKLRTFDNLLVRVPNEEIIKKNIVNLTHFPIRRFDLQLRVPYGTDMEWLRVFLRDLAERNPVVMVEPEPLFVFQRYGDAGIEFQYSVWGQRQRYLELRNGFALQVEAELRAEGIEIPPPRRSIVGPSHEDPVAMRTLREET